jgi:6-phosphofructokinase 1
VGVLGGYEGLLEPTRTRVLQHDELGGLLYRGGTILGTANRGRFTAEVGHGEAQGLPATLLDETKRGFESLGLSALVAIGGDGSLSIAEQLHAHGLPIVAVPKTIDNDLAATVMTFGFDSAVACATDALDRLHSTAESHQRVMVLEVMGRYAGWIALYAGVAGGADAILIPEIPFDLEIVAQRLLDRDRWGAKFSIVVVAEGALSSGGRRSVVEEARDGYVERLGGVGAQVCDALAKATGKETRVVVLGHLQRGGAPTSFDRVLATRFGGKAVELIRKGEFGTMVAFAPPDIVARRLEDVVGKTKTVPPDLDLLMTAKALGVTFGD